MSAFVFIASFLAQLAVCVGVQSQPKLILTYFLGLVVVGDFEEILPTNTLVDATVPTPRDRSALVDLETLTPAVDTGLPLPEETNIEGDQGHALPTDTIVETLEGEALVEIRCLQSVATRKPIQLVLHLDLSSPRPVSPSRSDRQVERSPSPMEDESVTAKAEETAEETAEEGSMEQKGTRAPRQVFSFGGVDDSDDSDEEEEVLQAVVAPASIVPSSSLSTRVRYNSADPSSSLPIRQIEESIPEVHASNPTRSDSDQSREVERESVSLSMEDVAVSQNTVVEDRAIEPYPVSIFLATPFHQSVSSRLSRSGITLEPAPTPPFEPKLLLLLRPLARLLPPPLPSGSNPYLAQQPFPVLQPNGLRPNPFAQPPPPPLSLQQQQVFLLQQQSIMQQQQIYQAQHIQQQQLLFLQQLQHPQAQLHPSFLHPHHYNPQYQQPPPTTAATTSGALDRSAAEAQLDALSACLPPGPLREELRLANPEVVWRLEARESAKRESAQRQKEKEERARLDPRLRKK